MMARSRALQTEKERVRTSVWFWQTEGDQGAKKEYTEIRQHVHHVLPRHPPIIIAV